MQTLLETLNSEDLARTVRTLKYQKKLLGKQLGKAGATIFDLRNQVAALREIVQFTPGDYKRVLARLRDAEAENRRLRAENRRLRAENRRLRGLAATEAVEPYHGKTTSIAKENA